MSSDLVHWERVTDALVRSDAPAFDDLATWTGSVVRHPDGRWFMFHAGASLNDAGANVQSIGYAVWGTKLLPFVHDRDGAFVGEITDPYAVSWDGDRLVLTPSSSSRRASEH